MVLVLLVQHTALIVFCAKADLLDQTKEILLDKTCNKPPKSIKSANIF